MMLITIITPIFEDWESFFKLVFELDSTLASPTLKGLKFNILGIDDGSIRKSPYQNQDWSNLNRVEKVEIIHLGLNLGHQRAIAVGLIYSCLHYQTDSLVIMDSDGEDSPSDVVCLIQKSLEFRESVLVAQRIKRSESIIFRLGYFLYQTGFRLLTGFSLPFGNFSLLPRAAIDQISYDPNIWNHFAAALNRLRFNQVRVPTARGKRYFGMSHMNLTSLTIHGLSAMSVYSNQIAIRLLFASGISSIFIAIGIVIVLFIKFTTSLAIPGWASQVVGTLVLGILFTLGFSLLLAFISLQSRHGTHFFPRSDSQRYIKDKEIWFSKPQENM